MQTYSLKGQDVTITDDSYSVKHKGERFKLGSRAGLSKIGSSMGPTVPDKEAE